MKKLLLAILGLLLPVFAFAAEAGKEAAPEMVEENAVNIVYPRGIAPNYDGLNLRDDLATDAQNVLFDTDLGAIKVTGFTRENNVAFGSQPVMEMGQYLDQTGTEFLLAITSNTFAYEIGNGTFTTIISTLNATFPFDCVSGLNRFICTSSSQAFYWIGGAKTVDVTTAPTAFPKGSMIEKHANRIWVAGVTGNGSSLYGSKFLNADNWVLAPNANDPVEIPIGLNDGDNITCLKSFNDGLVIGKKNSLWALVGKSQNDFTVVSIRPDVGCIQDKSMQIKQGKLYWLSKRGIEKLEGGQVILMSDPIKNLTDKIVQGYDVTTVNSITDDTQSDFQQGASTFVSYSAQPGAASVASPSTFTITTLTSADNMTPETIGQNSVRVRGQSFRVPFPVNTNLLRLKFGIFASPLYTGDKILWATLRESDALISTRPSNTSLSTVTLQDTQIVNIPGAFPFGNPNHYGGLNTLLFSSVTLQPSTTYWVIFYSTAFCDYGINTNCFFLSKSSLTNTNPQWYSYVQTDFGSTNALSATDYYFQLTFSSAEHTSTIKNLGTSVRNFLTFDAVTTGSGGSSFFFVRSANSVASIQSQPWTQQVVGASIAANANQYVQWRVLFTMFDPSNPPAVQSVSFNWVDSTSKQRVTSWVHDDRYYLACSTNTGAAAFNETVIVIDRFDNFSRLNGLYASSYAEAFQNRYFGTSTSTGPTSGLIYRMTSALNYNGAAIDSFVETKDYCGRDCAQVKEWDKLYIRTRSGFTGGTLSTAYQFDRDGTYSDLGDISLTETTGIINAKVPFIFNSSGVIGKTVRLRFSNNQVNQDFRLLGAKAFYNPRRAE